MIKRISRKKLDVEKYTNCLANAMNYRVYAEYWYLDTLVNEKWDCYVWNDYEAVMPIPFAKKFGVKYIIQPIYCQQLGVFHALDFSEKIFHQFEKKLHHNLVRSYHFNEENTKMFSPKGRVKVNQLLEIKDDFEKDFDKKTKKNIKSFTNKRLAIKKEDDFNNLIQFKKKNSIHEFNETILLKLFTILQQKGLVETYIALEDKELLGFCSFIKSKDRVVYINSVINDAGKKKSVTTGLLHHQIKEVAQQKLFLDFEGSSISTIHHFFKGFGAEDKLYTVYKRFI